MSFVSRSGNEDIAPEFSQQIIDCIPQNSKLDLGEKGEYTSWDPVYMRSQKILH